MRWSVGFWRGELLLARLDHDSYAEVCNPTIASRSRRPGLASEVVARLEFFELRVTYGAWSEFDIHEVVSSRNGYDVCGYGSLVTREQVQSQLTLQSDLRWGFAPVPSDCNSGGSISAILSRS